MTSEGDGDPDDVGGKGPDAFRTISEVAEELGLPQHVLRFWETRFPQIRPIKRGGGRRYYRPGDVELLRGVKQLLYGEGYTIRGVQRILREQGGRKLAQSAGAAAQSAPAQPAVDPDVHAPRPAAPQEPPAADDDNFRRDPPFGERPQAARSADERPGPPGPDDASVAENAQSSVIRPRLTEPQKRRLASAVEELNACRRLLDGWS